MRQETKSMLKTVSMVLGIMLAGIGVLLLAAAAYQYNPHVKQDQEPFDLVADLSGNEARVEFTATTAATYNFRIGLPVTALASWSKCPDMTPNADPGDFCPTAGQFTADWSIADTGDSQWHEWERQVPVEVGEMGDAYVGYFRTERGHHYAIAMRVLTPNAALRGRMAHARPSLAYKDDQMSAAFDNIWASLLAFAAVPFLVFGIPLILIGRMRKKPA